MIFELNVRYSIRCSVCGKKLDCAADVNSAENYDVVLVVEPHDCSRTTKRPPDGLTPGQSEQVRQMIQNALDTGSA